VIVEYTQKSRFSPPLFKTIKKQDNKRTREQENTRTGCEFGFWILRMQPGGVIFPPTSYNIGLLGKSNKLIIHYLEQGGIVDFP
jgi:hypothetical protein